MIRKTSKIEGTSLYR